MSKSDESFTTFSKYILNVIPKLPVPLFLNVNLHPFLKITLKP